MVQLTASDVQRILKDVPVDSTLFVSYIAGREPSRQALKEAKRAVVDEGISPRHFTGTLKEVRKTRRGETVFVIWTEERDSPRGNGGLQTGAFRCFNPALGKLLTLEVVKTA